MLYLVGGPPRVGKSALALIVLRQRGIPWLSTDTVRTVLRQVVPAIDEVDAGFPSADALATLMHPFIEQTIGVCLAQSPDYLIEGVEILPADIAGYRERFGETRSCFLGHGAMSTDDLRRYQGNNPWHEGYGQAELERLAGWIREWSDGLAEACRRHTLEYVDVASFGYGNAIARGVAVLLA